MQLKHGRFWIDLAPEEGGLVLRARWRDPAGAWRDLLRPPPRQGWRKDAPRLFGLWPMAPFANRAFGAVVDDGARRIALPPNEGGDTMHGFGWQHPWQITRQGPGEVVMAHERRGGADPYAYRAEMALCLAEDHLRITLSVVNLAGETLPYGLGLHPWFPAGADTRLTLRAAGELTFAQGYRATGHTSLEGGGPYAQGRPLPRHDVIAHSFTGWTGIAQITTPSQGLALVLEASDTLRHPVVWAPAEADFLCVEPQSHAIGAPSEAAARRVTPLAGLKTGQSLSGWMLLRPRGL